MYKQVKYIPIIQINYNLNYNQLIYETMNILLNDTNNIKKIIY